jgi:hypothetical protein
VDNSDFWKEAKQGMNNDFGVDFNGCYCDLEAKQKLVYDIVTNHFNDALMAMESPSQSQFQPQDQLLLHVDSPGGTGKMHVVRILSRDMKKLADRHGWKGEALRRCHGTNSVFERSHAPPTKWY